MGTTDASTVFGYGAAIAHLPPKQIRELAQLAGAAGSYHVELAGAPLQQRRTPLHTTPWSMGVELGDFEVVLSLRATGSRHINEEEGMALLLFVKWLLRSKARMLHRIVVLTDSTVILGAARKGRSSSQPINRIVRQLASLCFVGGLDIYLVYVPSEHNAADPPSRGGPRTWPEALRRSSRHGAPGSVRAARKEASRRLHRLTRFDRRVEKLDAAWRRLRESGAISSPSSSDTWSSDA